MFSNLPTKLFILMHFPHREVNRFKPSYVQWHPIKRRGAFKGTGRDTGETHLPKGPRKFETISCFSEHDWKISVRGSKQEKKII